jgi:hypothetical protein
MAIDERSANVRSKIVNIFFFLTGNVLFHSWEKVLFSQVIDISALQSLLSNEISLILKFKTIFDEENIKSLYEQVKEVRIIDKKNTEKRNQQFGRKSR